MTLTNWGFEDSAIDGECLRRADKSNMRFAPDGDLSWGIPYVHGDFCEVDGKAYFGELAFSQRHGASFRLNPTRGGFAMPLPFNTLPFKVDGVCRPLVPPLLPQSFLYPGLHRFVEQRLRFFPKVEAA